MDRFFTPKSNINLEQNTCVIEGEDVKHISRVLRCRENDKLEVCDMDNNEYICEIKEINKVAEMNEKEKTFLQQVIDVSEEIEKNSLEEPDYSLYTGITDLDKITCGLHKQELTIIGARPRCWKNNISITSSRIHSSKRSRNCNNKPGNVRITSYSKNVKQENKS